MWTLEHLNTWTFEHQTTLQEECHTTECKTITRICGDLDMRFCVQAQQIVISRLWSMKELVTHSEWCHCRCELPSSTSALATYPEPWCDPSKILPISISNEDTTPVIRPVSEQSAIKVPNKAPCKCINFRPFKLSSLKQITNLPATPKCHNNSELLALLLFSVCLFRALFHIVPNSSKLWSQPNTSNKHCQPGYNIGPVVKNSCIWRSAHSEDDEPSSATRSGASEEEEELELLLSEESATGSGSGNVPVYMYIKFG